MCLPHIVKFFKILAENCCLCLFFQDKMDKGFCLKTWFWCTYGFLILLKNTQGFFSTTVEVRNLGRFQLGPVAVLNLKMGLLNDYLCVNKTEVKGHLCSCILLCCPLAGQGDRNHLKKNHLRCKEWWIVEWEKGKRTEKSLFYKGAVVIQSHPSGCCWAGSLQTFTQGAGSFWKQGH